MKCEICQERLGSIRLIEHKGGREYTHYYCEACLKYEDKEEHPKAIKELSSAIEASPFDIKYIETTTCKSCGMTFAAFKRSGRMGCGACYGNFDHKLTPYYERLQRARLHRGLFPKELSPHQQVTYFEELLTKALEDKDLQRALDYQNLIERWKEQIE